MNHIGTQPLETNRLYLRKIVRSDAQAMFDNWASDSLVTKYLSWQAYTNMQPVHDRIVGWIERYETTDFYHWGIVYKETNDLIGTIGLVGYDVTSDSCEIGYLLSRKYWGKGIIPEAFRAVESYLFEQVGMNRIQGRHITENESSGKVMLKCGMKFEGISRQCVRNNKGEFADLSVYSILKSEWKNNI